MDASDLANWTIYTSRCRVEGMDESTPSKWNKAYAPSMHHPLLLHIPLVLTSPLPFHAVFDGSTDCGTCVGRSLAHPSPSHPTSLLLPLTLPTPSLRVLHPRLSLHLSGCICPLACPPNCRSGHSASIETATRSEKINAGWVLFLFTFLPVGFSSFSSFSSLRPFSFHNHSNKSFQSAMTSPDHLWMRACMWQLNASIPHVSSSLPHNQYNAMTIVQSLEDWLMRLK